jgi:hypothetical protein
MAVVKTLANPSADAMSTNLIRSWFFSVHKVFRIILDAYFGKTRDLSISVVAQAVATIATAQSADVNSRPGIAVFINDHA